MLTLDSTNGRLLIALSICVAVLLYGYSIYLSFICLATIGACVFYITLNLLNDSNSRTQITNFLLDKIGLQLAEHLTRKNEQPEDKKVNTFTHQYPWNGITLPKSLNLALEHFANSLIDDYINRWYKVEISQDNTFLLEIKYQIRYGSSTAVRALRNYNFAKLIQDELLPLVVLHANRVSKLIDAADEGAVGLEEQMLKMFANDLHMAMQSPESCEHYLSEIADHLVVRLMDDSRLSGRELDNDAPTIYATNHWPSEVCRHFLRQLVLSAVLMPILDFITNPDTLNLLVVTALEPNKSELEDTSKDERVPFLENLSKYGQNDVSDSLLVLKLSDLIRDPRLLQIFDAYLRDIHGPTHWLDCFLQTNDVLHRLQKINDNESPEFNEVFSDAWLLFSAFLHKSGKTQIELFSVELLDAFGKAIEDHSRNLLLKSVEEVYMILYHELNYNFVLQFCQSEVYLGYLCGASSDATFHNEEQQVKTESESGQSTGLSITQIPSRIWNVLRGDYSENEEQAKNEPNIEESVQTTHAEENPDDLIEDEMKPIDMVDSSFLEVDEFTFDQSINMNSWKVSIPLIERRRRFRTGKIYFVYILTIERNDETSETAQCCSGLQNTPKKGKEPVDEEDDEEENELEQQIDEFEALSQLPKAWSIARSYDEFHVFDRRLRSHFGSNSQPFALLPDRKMVCQRTKQFLESHRKHFENFLQQLACQPNLKHSELLFAFLTNPGASGFENSLISTNDIEASTKSASQRKQSESDDGEYLKPFISRLLSRALINDDMYTVGIVEEHAQFETYSLDSGAYSLNHDAASEDAHEQSMLAKISLKNPHLSHPKKVFESAEKPYEQEIQAIETFRQISGNISLFATHLLNVLLRPHHYLKVCFFTLVDLFSNMLNQLFGRELENTMNGVLDENTILFIVKELHKVVFDENQAELSQEEIQRRTQQAERLLKHWLIPTLLTQLSESAANRTSQTVRRIFNCFQNATLNRQLAFVLLDKLAQHILPPNAEQILDRLHLELKDSTN